MKNKGKKVHAILKEMEEIYFDQHLIDLDWMGCKIDQDNYPSYHHIEKASNLRKNNESDHATVENGAYLGELSHRSLHYIETFDENLYNSWNELFKIINNQRKGMLIIFIFFLI